MASSEDQHLKCKNLPGSSLAKNTWYLFPKPKGNWKFLSCIPAHFSYIFCHCLQLNWTSTLLWGPCPHPFLCQYTKCLLLSSRRNQKWAWLKGLQKWIWFPVTMHGIRASLAIVSLPSITLVGIVRLQWPPAEVLHLFNMLRRHYAFKHNCIRTVCAPLFLRQSLPDANMPSL